MRRLSTLAGLLLLLSATVAGATTLVKMELGDLAREADRIVVGTVVDVQGLWDESGRFIHTDVYLTVDRDLQGQGPAEFSLRTPGGRVDGEGQIFHGAASFEVGEQVLVFLSSWEDGTPKVLGYVQGKSSVVEGLDGRRMLRGGAVDGRSLDSVIHELKNGPERNVPLRPVR